MWIGCEEIDAGMNGFAAGDHLFERAEPLFAAPARVIEFALRVISNRRKIAGVEERAVISELGWLVPVSEAVGGVAHGERQGEDLSRVEGLFESVDGVEIARRPA